MQNSSSKCSDFNPTCRNLYTPTILNPAPFSSHNSRQSAHVLAHIRPFTIIRRFDASRIGIYARKRPSELSFVQSQRHRKRPQASRDAYLEGRANTWGCFVTSMARCPESGLGGTEQSVADALEVHRCVINVATNHGSLGSALLIDLMSNPFVLSETFIHNMLHQTCAPHGQDGFIRTAKLKAAHRTVLISTGHRPRRHCYEILCRDIEIRSEDD